MAHLSALKDGKPIKSESDIHDGFKLDELDHIPLNERLKMLLATKPDPNVLERESKRTKMSPPIEAHCSLQDVFPHSASCFAGEGKDERFSEELGQSYADRVPERNAAEVPMVAIKVDSGIVPLCSQSASSCRYEDLPGDCIRQETQANDYICSNQITCPTVKGDVVGLEKVDINICNMPQHPTLSTFPIKVKVEYSDNDLMSPCRGGTNDSVGAVVQAFQIKSEIHDEFGDDELDHIPLKERHRMLRSRQSIGTAGQIHISGLLEDAFIGQAAYLMNDINQHGAGKVKEESHSVDKQHLMAENDSHSIPETNASKLFRTSTFDSSTGAGTLCTIPRCSPKANNFPESVSPNPCNFGVIQENDSMCSSQTTSTEFISPGGGQEAVPANPNDMVGLPLSTFLVKVKVETLENGTERPCKDALGIFSNENMFVVKGEMGIPDESCNDEVDHMPLRQRIKLLISRKVSNVDNSRTSKCLRESVLSPLECNHTVSENAKPRDTNHRRKRKKTVTDSVETALEEDAPGLLQVLIGKGIMVDEIKLYGDMESEDALDILSNEDNFVDLEAVITKLFSQPASLLKFAPVRCTKGSKTNYCLACLISLVEQTRYLQFRKWPVEWGWCRDLQSFIFVFERHNRIVLERPEYGYATYFFELVDSLPIDWQIKRLVTAMKLTSCSRATLIENRSLLVGEDLTEGEARVLEEYGWAPNTGLGSMLNYCDRVVHDSKKERDGSEWKSKIGKLLMNGYNGGTIVLANLPKKVIEYQSTESPEIKLEL